MTSHDAIVETVPVETGPAVGPLAGALLVLLLAFLPPVVLAISLRNAERHRREPWRAVLSAFAWGGTFAVLLALLSGWALSPYFDGLVLGVLPLSTVLLAPLTEEIAKAAGLFFIPDADPEPEDGYVYGGAAGLGFAATENVLYIAFALVTSGEDVAIVTALYRGIVTVALHGGVSAIAGAAIWQARYSGRDGAVFRGLLVAMAIHAAYNASVVALPALAALVAGAAAVYVWWRVRRRVRQLDREGAAKEAFTLMPPLPPP